MADIGVKTARLVDSDGDALDDGAGRLKVFLEAADLNIGNVDVLSIIPGTGATNLGKAEDAAHTSGDVGVMSLGVLSAQASGCGAVSSITTGDYVSLQISSGTHAPGALIVTGGTKTQIAFQAGDGGILGLCVRKDSVASLVDTDGDFSALQVNSSGALYVDIADGGQLDALLDTIKVDTEAIKTAVELLDNAISGSEMQVDVVAALPAGTNAIGIVGHDITDMVSNADIDIGTTGAAIMGSTTCKRVDIMAHPDNTGYIWIGGSNVAVNRGVRLSPGDFYSIDIDDVAKIYAVASVDQEDIVFNYYT